MGARVNVAAEVAVGHWRVVAPDGGDARVGDLVTSRALRASVLLRLPVDRHPYRFVIQL